MKLSIPTNFGEERISYDVKDNTNDINIGNKVKAKNPKIKGSIKIYPAID